MKNEILVAGTASVCIVLVGCSVKPSVKLVEGGGGLVDLNITVNGEQAIGDEELTTIEAMNIEEAANELATLSEDDVWDKVIKVEDEWLLSYDDQEWEVKAFGDVIEFPTDWETISKYVEEVKPPDYAIEKGFPPGLRTYVSCKFIDGSWGSVNILNKSDTDKPYTDVTVTGLSLPEHCTTANFYGFKLGDTYDDTLGWFDANYQETQLSNHTLYSWDYQSENNVVYADLIITTENENNTITNVSFEYFGE